MLSQLMVLFGFFALVLVSILWINKAVRMFDKLIGDGQPAWVFLEFTALTLPTVIGGMLPIAAFAAAVYVVHRLSSESELTVIQATGYSPFRLGRAVLVFGVIVALMMSLLAHMLIPNSLSQLRLRESEISANVAARLLSEGEFLHPAPGITFYIRQITLEGELRDVFLSDRRDPDRALTYTSSRAYLVADGAGSRLVMVSGLAQTLRISDPRLFVTHFDDFSYDITSLLSRSGINLNKVTFAGTPELLRDPGGIAERTGASPGEVMVELHSRFTAALMCVVAALVGFSTLMVGSYNRLGVWRQVLVAFGLLVGVEVARSASLGPVISNAALWPLLYLPVLAGIALSLVLLWLAHHPVFWAWVTSGFRRRRAEAVS
ncbi:MAG: LPS export ABC transporter permease LptF [Alphaproteobacteria bacterium HGW-Alphaproteobacteria-1]|nr:MAG: LPS export ABC transporter permease LptF [Alphaproteobacteria bacterium HGW-Alphaproteobacteria-1]